MAAPALRCTAAAVGAHVLNDLMNANDGGPVVEDDGDEDYMEEAAEDDKVGLASIKD